MNKDLLIKICCALLLVMFVTLACGFTYETNFPSVIRTATPTLEEIQVTPGSLTEQPVLALKQPTRVSKPLIATNEEELLVNLYQRVNPSVVNIITYLDQGNGLSPSGQGSGFVFDQDGDIVTNSHVVHGADQVEVVFSNGVTQNARILGQDLNSDLAVIRVNSMPQGVGPLAMGTMEGVAVGQTVVALGNPFGLGGTLTRGIVSALGRTIPALTSFSIPQAIQTDAPINPGNSGGPLLNLAGEVIGVNAQIETGDTTSKSNSGIGFAIPVSIVTLVVPELIQNGKYEWSWLGIAGSDLNNPMKKAMGLSMDQMGAYISKLSSDGPAEKAGLRGSTKQVTIDRRIVEVGGDIIVGIDGNSVASFEDILIYIALNTHPGQDVILTLIRDGELMEIGLKLQKRPSGTVEYTTPGLTP